MRKQAQRSMVIAVVTIVLVAYGLASYGWYTEERSENHPDEEGKLKSDFSYGTLGVRNETRHTHNGTTLSSETKVQDYDDFFGKDGSRTGSSASTMMLLMVLSIVLLVLFVILVYLASKGILEDRIGKVGPYLPSILGQVLVLLLIVGPIWFSYDFSVALDEDVGGPSQALGGSTAFWVIFGGILMQFGVLMALSRTRLIYIPPLDEAAPKETP